MDGIGMDDSMDGIIVEPDDLLTKVIRYGKRNSF